MLAVLDYHFAQGGAQTCPGSGSCNCKFTNNIESLRTLISVEVETLVEQEVAKRLANMSNNNVESFRALIRDEVETQVEQKVVERLANISNNNIESLDLRALVRDEFETQVEQEVAERLANMSSKGAVDNDDCMNMGDSVAPLLSLVTSISNVIASYSCKGLPNCMTSMILTNHSISTSYIDTIIFV